MLENDSSANVKHFPKILFNLKFDDNIQQIVRTGPDIHLEVKYLNGNHAPIFLPGENPMGG